MRIYNTYTRTKEEFVPVTAGKVGMYGCGVTPYKPSHLGHAMQAVIFDVIRRYFEYKGYKVTYVRNYTDIDDKIISAATTLGIPPLEHSKNIMRQCDAGFTALRVRNADFEPKVSDHIPEIIGMINKLIVGGHGYLTNKGNVYFSVKSFPEYGRLSNQDLTQVLHGSRKALEDDKNDPLDFALWKASDEDEIFWDSPWGNGRPGWHIECSAMSQKYLGKHFDIHGGGMDLLFPHHENEIAQSKSVNGGVFANYWIHNGLLMVGADKMSKSLNNDVAITDWLTKFHPEVIRYLILTNHYRSHVQFVPERYQEANSKVYQTYQRLKWAKDAVGTGSVDKGLVADLLGEFESYMDNDFNTVPVIAMLHRLIGEMAEAQRQTRVERATKEKIAGYLEAIKVIGDVLGLFDLEPLVFLQELSRIELAKRKTTREELEALLKKRDGYRKLGKFAEADALHKNLEEMHIKVLDVGENSSWDFDFTLG